MSRPAFDLTLRAERHHVRVILHGAPGAFTAGPLAVSDEIQLDAHDLYARLVESGQHLLATATPLRGLRRARLMRRYERRVAYLTASIEVRR